MESRELPVALRLAVFALALTAVFTLMLLLGRQLGPIAGSGSQPVAQRVDGEHGEAHGEGDDARTGDSTAEVPGGLQVSEAGYTLVLAEPAVAVGAERRVEFRVEGPDGQPVTSYEIEHDKELHLIAVRRDFSGFQHVHPTRDAQGSWSATLDLTGGSWRIFADFTPSPEEGQEPLPLTLGADLAVTGPGGRAAVAADPVGPVTVDTVDGIRVELAGSLVAGEESALRFEVTRAGEPIDDLQPYLGARGHLVALREGDLAYLHVHPTDPEGTTGNEVGFAATTPSVGDYRLYLDFRVGDVVRTAEFAVSAEGTGTTGGSTEREDPDDTHPEDDDAH